VGGHCISVDPWFFVEAAPDITSLILNSRRVNDSQPDFVISTLRKSLVELRGKKIAVLGLAFKPDVDDLRESPAVEVAHKLHLAGAQVKAFEPYKLDFNHDGIVMATSLEDALKDADAILLLVNHSQFRSIDPSWLKNRTRATLVIDTVNGWNRSAFKAAGFTFVRLGDRKNI
jgi:UDP-N-acetyl-D-mannosaminuronic acid dehydrogenase